MEYRWDDFSLDREGSLLTREGQQVEVSRKVLYCISHLIEQRNRVVGYDELIHKVWGHDNVTNHQLTQIVVAARRPPRDQRRWQDAAPDPQPTWAGLSLGRGTARNHGWGCHATDPGA